MSGVRTIVASIYSNLSIVPYRRSPLVKAQSVSIIDIAGWGGWDAGTQPGRGRKNMTKQGCTTYLIKHVTRLHVDLPITATAIATQPAPGPSATPGPIDSMLLFYRVMGNGPYSRSSAKVPAEVRRLRMYVRIAINSFIETPFFWSEASTIPARCQATLREGSQEGALTSWISGIFC